MRKETRCRHIGYSFQLTARVLLYAPSHRQHCTYHSLCYTSRGALAGTRNSSMDPPHEGSIRWPWANALTTELHLAPNPLWRMVHTKNHCCYGLCYTSRGVLVRTRNSSMGSSWGIDPITHRTMSRRCTMELHFAHYRKFTVTTVRFTQNVSCNSYTHPK